MMPMQQDDAVYRVLAEGSTRVLAAIVSGDADELSINLMLTGMLDYDDLTAVAEKTVAQFSQQCVSMGGRPLQLLGFDAVPQFTLTSKTRSHVLAVTMCVPEVA